MSGKKKEPFKFSQFDEEFILQRLWGFGNGRCADIGARGRRGSNVAALLDSGWFCQLIDRDINGLLKDFPRKKGSNHQLVHATVTPENVNKILAPDLDLLSIDIDGDDYYVWEAVRQFPKIVIIETSHQMLEGVQKRGEKLGCSDSKMRELGQSKGYRVHSKTGPNLIFTHETFVQAST